MGKIIVVDDETDTIELINVIFEMNGIDSATFTVAGEAMEYLKKEPLPDLLLLDMRMPGMSGPDFCRELRKDSKFDNLRIVFFTASSDMDLNILKESRALGFIFKPFDNDELIKQIKKFSSFSFSA